MSDDVVKLGKYMVAHRVPCDPHDVWTINASSGSELALVEWYAPWRRYVLLGVEEDAVFSADCLAELSRFVGGLR